MRNEFIHKSYFIRKLLGGININKRYSEKKIFDLFNGQMETIKVNNEVNILFE